MNHTIRQVVMITECQAQSLKRLKAYKVNLGAFIRSASREKIRRDWPEIKERQERVKLPF